MKLTREHRAAGIIEVISTRPNTNGSWTCTVRIADIDRKSNGSNYRSYDENHTREFSGKNFLKEAIRNPRLKWNKRNKITQTIDGRHSLAAMLAQGITECTCDIHFNMNTPLAASVFFNLTENNKRMAPWDSYAAALEGEHDFAIDIERSLCRHGFTTPNDDGYNSKTADFNGFSPLKECQCKKGTKFLNAFLTVLKVWKNPTMQSSAKKNPFQRGLIDFLTEYLNEYSASDLAAILMKRSASEITERATDYGGDRIDRGHFKQAFESVLRINQRQRKRYRAAA
jgi:hypothetical protein